METYDVGIVGGGVLGFAAARSIAMHPILGRLSCVIFEKHKEPAKESSGRSSGVLHSAFHQAPDSLKARYSARGCELAKHYAKERGIPLRETGMLIVLPYSCLWKGIRGNVLSLWRLLRRGAQNKVCFRLVIGQNFISNIEPHVRAAAGIFIPHIAVVDGAELTCSLAKEAASLGVKILYDHEVITIDSSSPDVYKIATNRGFFLVNTLINAAGLYADQIANLTLREERYKIWPWRGDYYEIVDHPELIRGLVYPLMPPGAVSKGLHLAERPDGRLLAGPDARPARDKRDYARPSVLQLGLQKEQFLSALSRFLPDLKLRNLKWSHAGIRPKLFKDGRESDFILRVDRDKPLLVNMLGIDSPGLSAALAIAEDFLIPLLEKNLK